eukprot:TRINITY_DN10292_c0_g1_i2.p1 TRINITY_DN10292_c0_g1~~TRINITY_DN10292_c0_g1_i2.p1  ORF type:complete len:199 (-),score=28.18 TRINITY_DN10292_c0_g1_i2:369-965(-)
MNLESTDKCSNGLTKKTSIDAFRNFVLENFSESSADRNFVSNISEISQESEEEPPKRNSRVLRKLSRFVNCDSPIERPETTEADVGTEQLSIDNDAALQDEVLSQGNNDYKTNSKGLPAAGNENSNREAKSERLEKFLSKRDEYNTNKGSNSVRDDNAEREIITYEVKEEKRLKSAGKPSAIIPSRYSTSKALLSALP